MAPQETSNQDTEGVARDRSTTEPRPSPAKDEPAPAQEPARGESPRWKTITDPPPV